MSPCWPRRPRGNRDRTWVNRVGLRYVFSPAGKQLATKTVVKNGAGDLFGLITTSGGLLLVNDGTNALDLLHG